MMSEKTSALTRSSEATTQSKSVNDDLTKNSEIQLSSSSGMTGTSTSSDSTSSVVLPLAGLMNNCPNTSPFQETHVSSSSSTAAAAAMLLPSPASQQQKDVSTSTGKGDASPTPTPLALLSTCPTASSISKDPLAFLSSSSSSSPPSYPTTSISTASKDSSLQNILQKLINQHGTDAFENVCHQMGLFQKNNAPKDNTDNDNSNYQWECASTSTSASTDASSMLMMDGDCDDLGNDAKTPSSSSGTATSHLDMDSSLVILDTFATTTKAATTTRKSIIQTQYKNNNNTKSKQKVPQTQKEAKAMLRQGRSLLKNSTKETLTQIQIAQGVMEASFDPELTMNDQGFIVTVNHAVEDLFGWTKHELIGQSIFQTILQQHQQKQQQQQCCDSSSPTVAAAHELITNHLGKRVETVATCKSYNSNNNNNNNNLETATSSSSSTTTTTATTVPVELGITEISTPKGKIYCVFMHDLTRRKKSDAEKKLKDKIAQGIMEASFDPELTMKLDGTIQTVNHATETLFGYSKNQLLGQHICTILPETNNTNKFDKFDKFIASHLGTRTEVVAKHVSGKEIPIELGLTEIQLSTEAGDNGTTTNNNEEDKTGNDRIFCLFMHDLTRRKKNECILQKRKRQIESVMEASFDPDFTICKDGKIQNANHAAEDLFGYTKNEMIGQNISMILPSIEQNGDFMDTYLGKRSEQVVVKKDGHHVDVEMGVTAIDNGEANNEMLFCVIMHDLTRRKKRMRIAEGVMEASFDPELTMTCKGIVESANHAAEELFGWSKGELIGQNIKCLFPSDITNDPKTLQKFIQDHLGERQEITACCKQTGKDVPIELGLTRIETGYEEDRNEDETIYCLFMHDLTRRKKSDAEKLKRRKIAEGVMEASFDPEFTFTSEGIFQTANHAAEELFGWEKGELIGKSVGILFGDTNDWQLNGFVETHLNQRSETMAYKYDGSEVPVELGLTEIKTVGDEKLYCLFIHDLTRRRKNQEALARKQRITEGIVEASFDPMIAIDDMGSILMANKAACRQFGWSREELLDDGISKILFAEHSKKPYHFLKHYIKTWIKNTVGSQREMEGRRRNGEKFPIMLGLSEVDCKGNDHLYVAFIQDLTDQKKLIETEIEKAQAESLLLNMLPENIAKRLKDDPSHIAEKFASTTILFADIVGFTALSSLMSPVQTVKMLNDLFSRFDELLDSYQLNKVKTIGDCYMATSVPGSENQAESCASVCRYAFDLLAAVQAFNSENPGMNIKLRLGINSGPVVAGVVGTKRFLYDLWGDAVNMASRMESTGMPNRIQVSKEVVDLLRTRPTQEFVMESRGKILIKGKGDIETYWLKSQKKKQPNSPTVEVLQRNIMRRTSCPIIKGL